MRRKLTLILLAVVALALLSAPGTWTNQATSCTAASYAALPAAQPEGTLCQVTADKRVYRYSVVAGGLWLRPWMTPAALLVDYTGDALPPASGWTEDAGTESAAVAGGILTVTDASAVAGHYKSFSITNAAITDAANSTILAYAQVASQDANTAGAGYKAMIGLNPTSYSCGLALAGAAALNGASSVFQFTAAGNDMGTKILPYTEPPNSAYAVFYVSYSKDTQMVCSGVLGSGEQCTPRASFAADPGIPAGGVRIGTYWSAGQAVVRFDWVKVFVH